MNKTKAVSSPLRIAVRYLLNLGGAIDQLIPALFGVNKDLSISAAAGWMQFMEIKVWKIPIGAIFAHFLNILVLPFNLLAYWFGITETFTYQHCREAFVADKNEQPYTIWGTEWDYLKDE